MKASECALLQFLKNPKQFVIPIYQRPYSWGRKQCQRLWEDIIRTGNNADITSHFVGSLVYIESSMYQVEQIPRLLVIDGQQRLTTFSMLIRALANISAEQSADGELSPRKLVNYHLFNAEEDGDLHFKLILGRADKETLAQILLGGPLPDAPSRRLVENYRFFEDRIRSGEAPLDVVYAGLAKLMVVGIALNRDHDNPQLIFESLNSTGLDLTQADLIRNYVLMGQEPHVQEQLYKVHWYPMEQGFGEENYATHFDRFMRDYLIYKTQRIINTGDVYTAFKEYSGTVSAGGVEEVLAEVHRLSRYFVRMAFGTEPDARLLEHFERLNSLRVDVAYPLLLRLYRDYEDQILAKKDLLHILDLTESFIFRRFVCGVPTNALSKIFAAMIGEVDPERYVESIEAGLLLRQHNQRFPRDDEFRKRLVAIDVYNSRNCHYLLDRLENRDRKERVSTQEYTVEHILPQNEDLSPEWRQVLGPNWRAVQAQFLHTLGNLTLTGYNAELSDRAFTAKRDMTGGFADSPLRLNNGLRKLERWDQVAIEQRASELAGQAADIWPCPHLDEETLARYRQKDNGDGVYSYTLDDHPALDGPIGELFEALRERILDLSPLVFEEIRKYYIAYKLTTNFADVVPQKTQMKVALNIPFDDIRDPLGLCRNISHVRWGNGDVEVVLKQVQEIDDVINLVRQALDLQLAKY